MTHDEAFAALQARKRAAEAVAPPRVTWRKVSAVTGGGWSGLGPAGALVFVTARTDGCRGYHYGDVAGPLRTIRGSSPSLASAKTAAARLLLPPA